MSASTGSVADTPHASCCAPPLPRQCGEGNMVCVQVVLGEKP